MEWYWVLAALLGSILLLMFIGFPVGLAFIIVCTVAGFFIFGRFGSFDDKISASIETLTENAFSNQTIFAFIPIPMFLLMGELFFQTGLAGRMFNAVDALMGKVPARLSYVTVAGGTVFATLSGSSMGSTALMGTLMVPEMSERGYKSSMSIGPIMGTGGLAMLIPPSALAVLLGTIAEIDIGRLLIAGIVPGLILAIFYAILIFVMATLDPEAAPSYDVDYIPWSRRLALFLIDVVPMVSIIVMVILLIMGGVVTPSESAAYGSLGVIILAVLYLFVAPLIASRTAAPDRREAYRAAARRFTPAFGKALWKSMWGASRVTVIALLILFGSSLFSNVFAASGANNALILWIVSFDVSDYVLLLCMFGILLLLGMFMDQLAMMLLTVPIFFTLLKTPEGAAAAALTFDMPENMRVIWFAVIMLLAMEISFTTPPFGLLLFVMKGVAPPGTSFVEICLAAIPFMACAMLLVAIIVIFPEVVLWLPFIGGS